MKWAIITGASSGIGKALAFEFAAGHFDLLLTGRNEKALQAGAKHSAIVGILTNNCFLWPELVVGENTYNGEKKETIIR